MAKRRKTNATSKANGRKAPPNRTDESVKAEKSGKPPTKAQAEKEIVVPIEVLVKAHADSLQHLSGAGYLYALIAATAGNEYHTDSYIVFRDQVLKECGSPADPMECMLLEQLLLAFHASGRLHVRSAIAKHHTVATACADAAARLQAEFRRSLLALEDYREKVANRSKSAETSEARTENEAESKTRNGCDPKKKTRGNKLGSNDEEMPEWLKRRMQPPTPVASPPAVGTG